MSYNGYSGRFKYDPHASLFHGEVVGVRDVVTFQARCEKEMEQAFHESVDDYIAFCEQRGQKPESPVSAG